MIARSAALALAIATAAIAAPVRAVEMVRIAVVLGTSQATLAAPELTVRPLHDGAREWRIESGEAEVRLAGDALLVNGAPIDPPGAVFTSGGAISVAGFPLRGEVEVRRVDGGFSVIHALPLEDYVAAVTGSEMPPGFPPEALKAQAVAARTYAVFKKLEAVGEGRPWHLGATVLHQVYRGSQVDPRAKAAADATAGEVLVHEHAPIEAYFHSTCGGRTERGADGLGRDLPYLASVRCDRCRASPRSRWSVRIPAGELGRLLGLDRAVTSVRVVARTASGRARRVELTAGGRRLSLAAVDLRQRVGVDRLFSLAFDARLDGGDVVLDGRGSGHGVGLCQWGAAGAAREGQSHREILAYYYPGAELVRMY